MADYKKPIFQGGNNPTILLSGLGLAGETMGSMRDQLRADGIDARTWGYYVNCGPTKRAIKRIEKMLDDAYKSAGEPVTLVGHSFGGLMSLHLARKFPEKVKAVILVAGCAELTAENAQTDSLFGSKVDIMQNDTLGAIFNGEIVDDWKPLSELEPLPMQVASVVPDDDGRIDGRMHLLSKGVPNYRNFVLYGDHSNIKKGHLLASDGGKTEVRSPSSKLISHLIRNGIDAEIPKDVADHLLDEDKIAPFDRDANLSGQIFDPVTSFVPRNVDNKVLIPFVNKVMGDPWDAKHGTQLTSGPDFGL